MKNLIKGLLFLSILISLSSCKFYHITFKELDPKDYKNYISQCYNQTYSPTTYSVVVGYNPSNDYSWETVYVKSSDYEPVRFRYYYYKGSEDELIKAAYPNADIILYYNGTYNIGTKKEKDK